MRRTLSVVLIIIICSISIVSFGTDVEELQVQYSDIQIQLDEQNQELANVQSELSENLQQLQTIDDTINSTQNDLSSLSSEIDNLKTTIETTELKVTELEETYEKEQGDLDERLISVYEAGETYYLDVLLNSRSLMDFLSNYFLISEITEYDSRLIQDVENEKKEMEETKEFLQNSKNDFVTKKQNQIKAEKVLQNTKVIRENKIAELTEEEFKIQSSIDEYKQKFSEVEAEIKWITTNSVGTEYIGGVMAWPVPGHTIISSTFGMRTHPITGVYKLHTGIDIAAPMGTDFIAVADGIVTKACYNPAYGNMIIIDHGGGIETLYAHGQDGGILVQIGDNVKQGQPILKVGSTGYSTGPHAHFEVRVNGQPVNPLPYVTRSYTEDNNTNENNVVTNTQIQN